MAKPKKERAENYDEKLSVKGNFEELVKVSVSGIEVKKQSIKAAKKKDK